MYSSPTTFASLDAPPGAARAEEVVRALSKESGSTAPDPAALDRAIAAARDALIALQHPQGYWLFELEADCTIPAEYILMMHFLDEIDPVLQGKIANYLRAHQAQDGGWPLYHNGALDLSCSIKAYFALKLAGDSPQAPHMARARAAIIERGGAARANVFTRITLALFRQIPWRGVPYIPVEIVLLPRWFPFHIDKVSYWSRAVMVPLFILCSCKAAAVNPSGVDIRELFTTPPEQERHYFRRKGERDSLLNTAFLVLDRIGRLIDPLIPRTIRERALRRAEAWTTARLNGEDGLGAIFPAMVNALEAMVVRGVPPDDPRRVTAKRAIEKLVVVDGASAYCQPCVSPIWDTVLASLALQEAGGERARAASDRGLDWLGPRQLADEPGDWQVSRPELAGGGWAFQFANSYYPDLDDTAVVVWSMHQAQDAERHAPRVTRALDWLVGMQSRNGGFAAFDADNTYYYLNAVPFADHGALADPPTSDVTARVVTALACVGRPQDRPAIARAVQYLRDEQEADGPWFGRWGTNYIYGTWSVLVALARADIPAGDPAVRRAVAWLLGRQNGDGGFGETNDSYAHPRGTVLPSPSTPYQTAWALLALLAGGEGHCDAARRASEYLVRAQQAGGLWSHPSFTAPGFPRVFHLKYHGYCAYFPLWALAAYRNHSCPKLLP